MHMHNVHVVCVCVVHVPVGHAQRERGDGRATVGCAAAVCAERPPTTPRRTVPRELPPPRLAAGAPLVDDLLVLVLEKVALLLLPREHHRADLAHRPRLLLGGVRAVPLGQPHLALSADQQHKVDHAPLLCARRDPAVPCDASACAAKGGRRQGTGEGDGAPATRAAATRVRRVSTPRCECPARSGAPCVSGRTASL
jgi:hypothetical protein